MSARQLQEAAKEREEKQPEAPLLGQGELLLQQQQQQQLELFILKQNLDTPNTT